MAKRRKNAGGITIQRCTVSNIERIKCGNGNAYLVSDGDDAVLVDTCRVSYRDMVLEKCKTKNVRIIILTHGHVDHIQNAAFLSKALSVPIAMHKGDYELTKDNWAEPMYAHNLLANLSPKHKNGANFFQSTPFILKLLFSLLYPLLPSHPLPVLPRLLWVVTLMA